MLIPVITISSNEDNSKSNTSLIDRNNDILKFIKHISILSISLIECSKLFFKLKKQDDINLINMIIESVPCMIESFDIDDDKTVGELLDNGLRIGFFRINNDNSNNNSNDIQQHYNDSKNILSTFPRSRVGITIDIFITLDDIINIIKTFRDVVGHFLIKCNVIDKNIINSILLEQVHVDYSIEIYFYVIDMNNLSLEDSIYLATIREQGVHAIAHPKILNTDNNNNDIDISNNSIIHSPTLSSTVVIEQIQFDFLDSFIGCLKTDRSDGLYTTIVCDENNLCLGLVYSSKLSIRLAFLESKGIYWSRSRNNLWRKGESSGMIQQLLLINYDCDRDALKFNVIQQGSFCHLMTRNCWGKENNGLLKLENTLKERLLYAPDGSYTKRLFNDSDLLRKKLLEEVQELVEANEPNHIASEAADVMYFLLTRCVAAGVSLNDIANNLDKKSLKVIIINILY